MKALIWEDLNASIAYQGYDGCICAIAQFPVFMMASRFNRISPYKRLLIAVAMDLGMFIIDYFARIPQLIVAGSVLNGVAYAFMVASFREIIQKNTSYKLSTTAQGIGDAFYMSLSGVFGSLLSGWLADLFGMKPMILTLALLQLIPLTLCFFFFRRAKRLGEANP